MYLVTRRINLYRPDTLRLATLLPTNRSLAPSHPSLLSSPRFFPSPFPSYLNNPLLARAREISFVESGFPACRKIEGPRNDAARDDIELPPPQSWRTKGVKVFLAPLPNSFARSLCPSLFALNLCTQAEVPPFFFFLPPRVESRETPALDHHPPSRCVN